MDETEQEAVARFVKLMLAKIDIRRQKYKPFGWRDPSYKTLRELSEHLESEVGEWGDAENWEDEMEELIDVANTAFMLWDRLRLDQNKTSRERFDEGYDCEGNKITK